MIFEYNFRLLRLFSCSCPHQTSSDYHYHPNFMTFFQSARAAFCGKGNTLSMVRMIYLYSDHWEKNMKYSLSEKKSLCFSAYRFVHQSSCPSFPLLPFLSRWSTTLSGTSVGNCVPSKLWLDAICWGPGHSICEKKWHQLAGEGKVKKHNWTTSTLL